MTVWSSSRSKTSAATRTIRTSVTVSSGTDTEPKAACAPLAWRHRLALAPLRVKRTPDNHSAVCLATLAQPGIRPDSTLAQNPLNDTLLAGTPASRSPRAFAPSADMLAVRSPAAAGANQGTPAPSSPWE